MIAKHWNRSIKQTSLRQKKNEYLDLTGIGNTDSNNNEDANFHDYHQGQADESDESTEGEEEKFNPGDVIWNKHGRLWYPVQICNLNDVPSNLQHRFCVQNNKVIVKLLISQFISDWCSWWKPSWCSKSYKIYFYNGAVQHCSGKTTFVHIEIRCNENIH